MRVESTVQWKDDDTVVVHVTPLLLPNAGIVRFSVKKIKINKRNVMTGSAWKKGY